MKLVQVVAAAILAGGLLTAPAMAGVTGTEGGSKTITTSTTETVKRVNTTVQKSQSEAGQTVVRGHVDVNYWYGAKGLSYGQAGGWRYYSTDREVKLQGGNVQSAINSMISSLKGYKDNLAAGRSNVYSVSQSKSTDDKTWTTTSDYSFANRQTDIASTRTTTTTPGTIIVGDPDALESAYVAAGSVNQHTQIDITYTDTYQRDQTLHTAKTTYYQVNVTHTISPIVLDLDGDGRLQASAGKYLPHPMDFDSTRIALFDFNANGFPVLTEWLGPQDGLLCRPHADGSVDGASIFGTASGYDNGYEALSALDLDRNGRLEGSELAGMMVWQDSNGNAVADAGELLSLDGLGITSIGVKESNLQCTFVRNGKTFKSFDWWPSVMELRKKDMGRGA